MTIGQSRRIAVIGAGLIGSALAGHLILAGNKVIIGTRRPADLPHRTTKATTSIIRFARSRKRSMARKSRSWRSRTPPSRRSPTGTAIGWPVW
jgi:3-hydroxyacyl-CoA dehydrogenase